jgi:predicted DsbA family dithiol-disulfide isomerase
VTPGNNGLDLAQLPIIAGEIGLDVNAFNQCLDSGTYAKKVQDSYNEALAAGAEGTPYILIMVGNESVALSGAQSYASMRAAIDAVLSGLPGGGAATSTNQ